MIVEGEGSGWMMDISDPELLGAVAVGEDNQNLRRYKFIWG